jgi:ABC-type nitrate/sulfonate/bicarbonate transport system ATPase subunit
MAQAGTLEIRGLHKDYEVKGQPLAVLEDVSLTVRPGEFVSVVGSSGCGKSTLLRLVIGLEDDYRGEILLDGQRIVGTSLDRGIVFQEHRLFPWLTVEQNVGLSLLNAPGDGRSKRRVVQEHIELVGLKGFESAWPHQLSGGMAQRVALCRALALETDIILMDEPFAALDEQSRILLGDELVAIWRQVRRTIVFVTHSLTEAVYLGRRIAVFTARPGRIKLDIVNDLPRPRATGAAEFNQMVDRVWQQLKVEALTASASGTKAASEEILLPKE